MSALVSSEVEWMQGPLFVTRVQEQEYIEEGFQQDSVCNNAADTDAGDLLQTWLHEIGDTLSQARAGDRWPLDDEALLDFQRDEVQFFQCLRDVKNRKGPK